MLLFESAGPNPAMDLLRVTGIVLVPFSLIAPFMGVLIDRMDRRTILVWTPFIRAAVAGVLALSVLGDSGGLFMLAVLIILSLNRFFLATLSAVLPQLVPEEDLIVANASSSTAGAGASATGHAIGSLVSGGIGGRATAALSGIAFAAGGLLARDLPVHGGLVVEPAPWREEARRVLAELRDGIGEMRHAPRVARGMRAIGMLQLLVGMLVAILLHYLVGELQLGPSSGFAMLAVLAIGVGAGVLLVPILVERIGSSHTIRIAFIVGAVGCAIPVFSLNRALMSLASGLVGVAYALVKVPVDTIVQEDIGDEARGRAFSVYDMLFNGARILGTAASAIAYEFGLGTRAQTTIVAILFLIVATQASVPARVRAPGSHAAAPATEGGRRRDRDHAIRPAVPTIPIGALLRIAANDGGRAEEEPAAIIVEGGEHPIELLWRGRVTAAGVERRVLGLALGTLGIRVIADPRSGAWEVTDTWTR